VTEKVIGVPWKGRNFRKAASKVFEDTFYDPEFLADQFNGRSKKEAKSKRIGEDFLREVNLMGWSDIGRFRDTGRRNPRFGFKRAETRKGCVVGYCDDPFSSDFEEVYVPDDLGLEASIDSTVDLEPYAEASDDEIYLGENAGETGRVDLGEVLEDQVSSYQKGESIDDGVSLAAMVSEELDEHEVEKVLVSEDLEKISRSIGRYVWGDIDFETFRGYAERQGITEYDEEGLIGRTPEVAGVYIVDSGGTAERNGLEYQRIADTALQRWTKPENAYKELEGKSSQEAIKK